MRKGRGWRIHNFDVQYVAKHDSWLARGSRDYLMSSSVWSDKIQLLMTPSVAIYPATSELLWVHSWQVNGAFAPVLLLASSHFSSCLASFLVAKPACWLDSVTHGYFKACGDSPPLEKN